MININSIVCIIIVLCSISILTLSQLNNNNVKSGNLTKAILYNNIITGLSAGIIIGIGYLSFKLFSHLLINQSKFSSESLSESLSPSESKFEPTLELIE